MIVFVFYHVFKIEAGKMELEQKPFSLQQCLQNITTIVKVKKQRPPKIKLITNNIPEYIVGDEPRLTQVLLNLINNAVKFCIGEGDITLEVSAVSSADHTIDLKFCVTDNGIGIPVESQSLLFQMFSQVDSSISRRFGGTGLGLAVCQKIVNLMNGKIWLEKSVPNQGSTFCFTCRVGIYDSTTINVEEKKVVAEVAFPAVSVLVAEDNAINRKVICKMLESIGLHDVTVAVDGQQALGEFTKRVYDVLLTDLSMPGMSGIELSKSIRRYEKEKIGRRRCAIIAVTAHATEQQRLECIDVGMDSFITKPVVKDALRKAIVNVLS
jgi:CheY-like chemotaxis protein